MPRRSSAMARAGAPCPPIRRTARRNSPIATRRWTARPATRHGRRAASAATSRWRRTTRWPPTSSRAPRPATSRPTIRRLSAMMCSCSARTARRRATASRYCAHRARCLSARRGRTASGSTPSSRPSPQRAIRGRLSIRISPTPPAGSAPRRTAPIATFRKTTTTTRS